MKSLLVVLPLLLVACGSESPSPAAVTEDAAVTKDAAIPSDTSTGYSLAYVPVGSGLSVGKSRFQLRVSQADGSPAPGLARDLHLAPLMKMEKMSHGNPVPPDAVQESATPGLYDVTTFFTMASVDSSGASVGQWTLGVSVGTAPRIDLPVEVRPATGTATTHVILRNAADTISSMGMSKPRSWVLFRDAFTPDGKGGATFGVFLATVQDGLMIWPPVTKGLALVDATGKVQLTVASLSLQASTDGTTWTPMNCDANARCTATVSSSDAVLVKLQVNGKDYTTDGAPAEAKNEAARFVVTP